MLVDHPFKVCLSRSVVQGSPKPVGSIVSHPWAIMGAQGSTCHLFCCADMQTETGLCVCVCVCVCVQFCVWGKLGSTHNTRDETFHRPLEFCFHGSLCATSNFLETLIPQVSNSQRQSEQNKFHQVQRLKRSEVHKIYPRSTESLLPMFRGSRFAKEQPTLWRGPGPQCGGTRSPVWRDQVSSVEGTRSPVWRGPGPQFGGGPGLQCGGTRSPVWRGPVPQFGGDQVPVWRGPGFPVWRRLVSQSGMNWVPVLDGTESQSPPPSHPAFQILQLPTELSLCPPKGLTRKTSNLR